ncbi:WhiB family transcriptional regulator [Kribbella sp. NBC_00889]|uniref:WhiB family transcriptional regulator n=1 Tax=Kribbella sp. NBC_00889 TaxID=2975974 RepID=UPI003863ACB8
MSLSMDLPAAGATSGRWMFSAACAGLDPELFFPIGTTGPAIAQIEQAKQICCGCGVLEECRRWAMNTGQEAGVWGGLSEEERRALRQRRVEKRRRELRHLFD